jgi:hypothetical protein
MILPATTDPSTPAFSAIWRRGAWSALRTIAMPAVWSGFSPSTQAKPRHHSSPSASNTRRSIAVATQFKCCRYFGIAKGDFSKPDSCPPESNALLRARLYQHDGGLLLLRRRVRTTNGCPSPPAAAFAATGFWLTSTSWVDKPRVARAGNAGTRSGVAFIPAPRSPQARRGAPERPDRSRCGTASAAGPDSPPPRAASPMPPPCRAAQTPPWSPSARRR